MRLHSSLSVVLLLATLVAVPVMLVQGSAALAQRSDTAVSEQERTWLDLHGPLRIGWTGSAPAAVNVVAGEVEGGYAVEAWDLAAARLGVELDHVAFPDEVTALAALDAGGIDVLGALSGDPVEAHGLAPVGRLGDVSMVRSWARPDTVQASLAGSLRSSLTDADLARFHLERTGHVLLDGAGDSDDGSPLIAPAIGLAALTLLFLAVVIVRLRVRLRDNRAELADSRERLERREHDLEVSHELLEERIATRTSGLRRSNEALQEFSSTAAHDLRGPLAAIRGLTSLIASTDLSDEERNRLLGAIGNSATRLSAMVETMLEDAVATSFPSAEVDGPSFASWLEEVTEAEVAWVEGSLHVHAPARVIDADVEVLRRAAVNLVGNALKYAVSEDGVVVEVYLRREEHEWVLVVSDGGPGIPFADHAVVFDRGTRLVPDKHGYGMGLAAVRDLVNAAGGLITVGSSATLGGAEFTVEVPTVTPTEWAPPGAEPHEGALGRTSHGAHAPVPTRGG